MNSEKRFEKIRIINRDVLKYIALILMGVGHMIVFIGTKHFEFLPKPVFILFFYGQFFAPPVFFFFISEGFVYTKSRKKYALRLALITLITQIPFFLCEFEGEPVWKILVNWSVMASLLAGLLVLMVWESGWKLHVRIIVMLAITAVTFLLTFEWEVFAPVLIFVMYILRDKPIKRFLAVAVILFIHQFICNGFVFYLNVKSVRFLVAEMAAITLITFFYNGKKGRFPTFSKWIFYVFYPLHLLAAYLIKQVL